MTSEQTMPKTVSASEAKNRLGAIMSWVLQQRDEIIIANRGVPQVVMLPFEEYEALQVLKRAQQRRDALAQLEQLREQVSQRNQDLTEDQAMELADRFVREAVDEMVVEGKIKFKRG